MMHHSCDPKQEKYKPQDHGSAAVELAQRAQDGINNTNDCKEDKQNQIASLPMQQ